MLKFYAKPIEPLDNDEIRTFFTNIDLILKNSEKILQNEKYRNVRVRGTGIDGIYLGHIDLLLGELITLWTNGIPWRDGNKLYYHLGGSPLSGMSFCTYWKDGKVGCDKNKISFCSLLKPASIVIKNLTEQPSEISVPLPARKCSEMNINDLIELLSFNE